MEIAVISGKGGTGKSSISAAFATAGDKLVVADCDVDAANLYLLFQPEHEKEEVFTGSFKAVIDYSQCTSCGICVAYCRFDAISWHNKAVQIKEVACDGCFLCSRICPMGAISMVANDKSRLYSGTFRNGKMIYGWLAPGEENSGRLVSLVRERAKQAAEENDLKTIILDGPPGIGCPVISTITGADKVVIVTEPTVSGLMDLQRAAEIVKSFNLKPRIIINKYDLNEEIAGNIEEWCKDGGMEIYGRLAFDLEMTIAMVHHKSIVEWNPDNQISIELSRILAKLLNDKT